MADHKEDLNMRKIVKFIIFVAGAFIFSILLGGALLNAETVVIKQVDESLLIKERTERAIMELAPLPNGIELDPKNPGDAETIIRLWNKSLPEVVIGGKSETRILNLFPIVVKKVITGEKRLSHVGSEWNVKDLPDRKEVANHGYVVLLIFGLVIVFTSIVAVSMVNRWYGKSIKLLFFYYALVLIISAASIVNNAIIVSNTIFFVLSLVSICTAGIVIGSVVNYTISFRVFIASAIVMCGVVIGSMINVLIAVMISLYGNRGVGWEYFLFVLVAEVLSFIIATMIKNIHDKQKAKPIGKPPEEVMTN